MDETQVRNWLAKQLHRHDVPEPLWQYLIDERYVREILDREDEAPQRLVQAAKKQLSLAQQLTQRTASPGRWAQRDFSSPWLTDYERGRAEAVARYYAMEAAAIPLVRRFRSAVLGDALLAWEHAVTFLASPAPWHLPGAQFETLGIPIVGHRSRIVAERKERMGVGGERDEVRLQLVWQEKTYERTCRYDYTGEAGTAPRTGLYFVERDGSIQHGLAWPGTVFGELGTLSAWLAQRYNWHEPMATMFVLTGVLPQVSAVKVTVMEHTPASDQEAWPISRKRHTITLTVEPWVSADTVSRIYRAYQQLVLGHDNRPLESRSLALIQLPRATP